MLVDIEIEIANHAQFGFPKILVHKRFEVLGISDKYPNKVGNKQLCNGLDSITRLNTQDLGIVSYLNLGHCLLVTN